MIARLNGRNTIDTQGTNGTDPVDTLMREWLEAQGRSKDWLKELDERSNPWHGLTPLNQLRQAAKAALDQDPNAPKPLLLQRVGEQILQEAVRASGLSAQSVIQEAVAKAATRATDPTRPTHPADPTRPPGSPT